MTNLDLRGERPGTAVLLAIFVVLTVLALVVARDARQAIRSPDETIVLFPGFTVDELPSPDHGLVVTSLQSASQAQMNGIAVGDELLAIDNHPVGSLKEAERIMNQNRQTMLALRLLHNASPRDVTLHQNGVRRHGA